MGTSMTKWEVARYLIDAKKCVDSLWFISKHYLELNIDVRKQVEQYRNSFYINAASVVDKEVTKSGNKKAIKVAYPNIEKLFFYRDRHAAHKDDGFVDSEFESLTEIVGECKRILSDVKAACINVLPSNITLDYVCYDRDLFRMLHGITRNKEEEIKIRKYPLYKRPISSSGINKEMMKLIFNDTEDIRKIEDKSDYCTVCNNGLTWDEGLQERQDFCIKSNVLFGTERWIHPNEKQVRACNMLKAKGYFNEFGMIQMPNKSEDEIRKDFEELERFMSLNI